jgi:hypothetical protein
MLNSEENYIWAGPKRKTDQRKTRFLLNTLNILYQKCFKIVNKASNFPTMYRFKKDKEVIMKENNWKL